MRSMPQFFNQLRFGGSGGESSLASDLSAAIGRKILGLIYAIIAEEGFDYGIRRTIVRLVNELAQADWLEYDGLKKEATTRAHKRAGARLKALPWYGWLLAVAASMAIRSPLALVGACVLFALGIAYLFAHAGLLAASGLGLAI